jgi:hypothetical protein
MSQWLTGSFSLPTSTINTTALKTANPGKDENSKSGPKAAAQACSPHYLEGRDSEECNHNNNKKVLDTPSQPMAGHRGAYLSSQLLWKAQIDHCPCSLGHKRRPYLKNNQHRLVECLKW